MAGRAKQAERTVAEQVEIAVEPHHLHFLGVGEIARDVVDRVALVGPPCRLELVVLRHQRRIRELRDVSAVVEMQVTDDHVFDVVGLHADLGELRGDRVVLGHLQAEPLRQRPPPSLRIGDGLVVVAGVEDNVAARILDDVEADRRPVYIALAADLQRGLGEAAERSRGEDV